MQSVLGTDSFTLILWMVILLQYGVFIIFKVSYYENSCLSKQRKVAQSLRPNLRDRATDEFGFNSRQWPEIPLFFKTDYPD
jgi:hypothetical protein